MRRLSWRGTFWFKRLLPIFMIAVSLYVAPDLFAFLSSKRSEPAFPLFMMVWILLAVFVLYMMKRYLYFFDMVDEVWDLGHALLIRRGSRSVPSGG